MRFSRFLPFAVLFLTAACLVGAVAQINPLEKQANAQLASRQATNQPAFEYATLVTQAIQENNGMVYTVTWNAGVLDMIGRSTTSLVDARRKLTAQLGNGNKSRTNLSVLLTSLGADGWRLVESNQNEFGTTRIFVRNQR